MASSEYGKMGTSLAEGLQIFQFDLELLVDILFLVDFVLELFYLFSQFLSFQHLFPFFIFLIIIR